MPAALRAVFLVVTGGCRPKLPRVQEKSRAEGLHAPFARITPGTPVCGSAQAPSGAPPSVSCLLGDRCPGTIRLKGWKSAIAKWN